MSNWHRVPFHQPGASFFLSGSRQAVFCTDARGQAGAALPREEGTTPRGPLLLTHLSADSLPLTLLQGPQCLSLLRCPRGCQGLSVKHRQPGEEGEGRAHGILSHPGAFSGLQDLCRTICRYGDRTMSKEVRGGTLTLSPNQE